MSSGQLRPTKKQQALLEFIDTFITEHGYSPSYREIMTAQSYNSVSTVAKHVDNLIKRGHLVKRENSARSLEVVGAQSYGGTSHKEWLCERIDQLIAEDSNSDDLYVLVGALKVLGFEAEMKKYIKYLG